MLQVRRKKETPDHVLKRTYQNELRALGRYCDDKGLRAIGIYEVDDGFLLRAFADPNDPHSIEAIEVPKDDIQNLMVQNFSARSRSTPLTRSPLCPTGYEDFLRALGYELEINQARVVAIHECVDRFAVSYHHLQPSEQGYVWDLRSVMLQAEDVGQLLDQAFGRRGMGGD